MFDAADIDRERGWAATVIALLVAVVGGSALFPERVYGGFVWHYFWGPVFADANGAQCAVWDGGARELLYDAAACTAATEPVAYPGYTLVSEVGYMVSLIVALYGVLLLLDRLDIGSERSFFFALFPYMFFGGALRVVEDATNAARDAGVEPAIAYPWNSLIISPVIYFTVFFVTLAVVVAAVALERGGHIERYERPVAAAGVVLTLACVGWLLYLAATTGYVELHPAFTVLTFLFATLFAAVIWALSRRYAPAITRGTPRIGPVVIWAHAVDGVANVIGISWGAELGLQFDMVPKHPVNRFIIDVAQGVIPPDIAYYTGYAWPFLAVKLVVATAVVWLFDDTIFDESPRYAVLLLVAIVAVGLGPGSRDMLRATFGV
jgi:uncharacterized membrane protein